MAKNRALGRGLDSLMKLNVSDDDTGTPAESQDHVAAGFVELDIDKVTPNPNQPRKDFENESLEYLSQSIKTFGIIQPITVAKFGTTYEIVAGERRYRAAKLAGLDKIPVIIKDLSRKEQFELSIVENIQRVDLNPIEEALAYLSLIDTYSITHEHLAGRMGKSRTSITNTMRLLNLDPQIQRWLIEGKISSGHARTILSIPDKTKHIPFANWIIERNLSVREAEKLSKKWQDEEKTGEYQTAGGTEKKRELKEIELKYAEEKLSSKLQTKAIINGNSKNGKIVIEYFSLEELERLMEVFGVNVGDS